MHPDLRRALEKLALTVEPVGPVLRSYRGGHLKANSVVNWFVALFQELGYEGCSIPVGAVSSPSPPATFIARGAVCATCNCSQGTVPSKPPSATSMATPARRGGWWRTFRGKSRRAKACWSRAGLEIDP